ncbi:MAG: Ig-like domain-containing protein [bacterium]|nr:MAG: Ig-like domain-containing protein [bacterium]
MKRYSRLANVEEKKNIKKAYLYVVLSIIALVLLVFLGIPTLVRFAGFVGEITKSGKPVEIVDTTPPAPPQFDEIPEFTNSSSLKITGKSESGATILIRANNSTVEVVANSDGEFNYTFQLKKGENTLDAKARDLANNESTQTNTYRIIFDSEVPEIVIESPADGASFYGSGQRQLSVKGTVSEKVNLTINERLVTVRDDGTFNFATTLTEGENKFEVKAVDMSGNESSTSFTVNFAS